ERIPAAAGIVNLRYKSCPEMAGQDQELYPDSEDVEAKTVFPDVIVHRRGTQQNHLVLEFKKSTSRVDRRIDLLKLQGYKQQLGYDHALFVEVGTEGQSIITALEWV
ncbi:hypothetical protein, partial [Enterobacter hormaechei]|uniref:hypothetical protein n=1 Tax=Enterobacter hormaechei TaxID=158836 RepID=UPI002875EA53